MPRGDGTGPIGLGTMTGRGAGFCAGFKMPGYAKRITRCNMSLRRVCGYKRMFCLSGLLPACAYLAYRWAKRNRATK